MRVRCSRLSNTVRLSEANRERLAVRQLVRRVPRKAKCHPGSAVTVQMSTSERDLFVSSGARIVLTADIDVLDNLAVTFVSIVIEAKA